MGSINYQSDSNANNQRDAENTERKVYKMMTIDITDLSEEQKERLRGAIRFFTGDRANIKLQIKDGENIKPCGRYFYE